MGKITDYRRTNYKDMIYMFVVGEQAAYLLQNVVNEFQDRYVYVSTGVAGALCIGSAACVHAVRRCAEAPAAKASKKHVEHAEEDERLGGD